MKLLSLNLQCGAKFESLTEYLKSVAIGVDIFCFQEVSNNLLAPRSVLKNARPNLFADLENILPDFTGYYTAPDREDDVGGLAIFVRKNLNVQRVENFVILGELDVIVDRQNPLFFTLGRSLQRLQFNSEGRIYNIFNFHGMWITTGKGDTAYRIMQSEQLRKIIDGSEGAKIFCCDLNIEPGTKSLAILTEGNIDLVQKFVITSTRSRSKGRSEIVDYVIVSPEVDVASFEVPDVEVSDHLPLVVEFE